MRKYDLISALSEETARRVARNDESWKKYLNTASGLYKYPFKDQLLIYAQRPDATARPPPWAVADEKGGGTDPEPEPGFVAHESRILLGGKRPSAVLWP